MALLTTTRARTKVSVSRKYYLLPPVLGLPLEIYGLDGNPQAKAVKKIKKELPQR